MKFSRFLLTLSLSLIGLLLFAKLLMGGGVTVFDMIFDLANGDAAVLSFLLCGFVLFAIVGGWVWSVKSNRPAVR